MISTPKTASGNTPVKSQKTASRIPLPDQKKATLVDIRGRRTSGIPMPKFEKGLSFGGRRIDSPDPLKVLDHGIRRRQLKRSNTGGSSSTASTVPTRFLSNSTPTVDRSKANTPDSTMGSSSEEEEEVTTPSDKPTHFVKHGYKPKHVSRASGSNYAGAILKVYDEAEVILGRPPPSNSPFTGPLPTIPSQSALPLLAASARNSLRTDPRTKVVMKPTEFSVIAERISVLQDSRGLLTGDRHDRQSLVGSDTKSELVNILRDAEHEDAIITQCGAEGLDVEMKEEITSTLGMLEGRCGPTNTTVDLEHLSRMFGRLKSGFEKAPRSAAFIEDATAAEQFLARRESIASQTSDKEVHLGLTGTEEASPVTSQDDDATSQVSRSKTVASKWSTSTPSAKEHPLPFAETGPRRDTFGMDFEEVPPALPPKHLTSGDPISIGYPSRESGKVHRLIGTDDRAAGARKTTARRESSPTLGIRIPGSVRAAREKARDAAGSRANQTSTTKFEKLPTSNTKVFRVSHDPPRGRLQSAEKTSHHDSTKVSNVFHGYAGNANIIKKPPRSRSKSRFMLDKLNGLFSGRRDKRNSQLPPVPPAKNNSEYENSVSSPKETQIGSPGSPLPNDGRIPPLPKMPTMTPPVDAVHPALRSAPSSTSVAPSTMTIGSDADMEGRRSLQALSEKLLGRALKESDPAKKERLLNFAKVEIQHMS